MSSEPKRQPAPRPRRRRAGPGERPDPAALAAGPATDGPAGLAPGVGYDPDDPASWPSGAAEADPAPAGRPSGEPKMLTDPIVMRALAHPVRTALFELLSALDTLTATQASEILGESPANCAFHLRTLAKYGFAEEAGGGRGRERPWKATNLNISISTNQDDRQAAVAAGELGKIWLEQWIERARTVYGSATSLPGWEHASGWSRNAVFLTPQESMDLARRFQVMLREYEPRKSDPALRPPGALPVEWSVFQAPIAELAALAEEQAREAASRKDGGGAAGRKAGPGNAGRKKASSGDDA
jgi:hypothetical protein